MNSLSTPIDRDQHKESRALPDFRFEGQRTGVVCSRPRARTRQWQVLAPFELVAVNLSCTNTEYKCTRAPPNDPNFVIS